MPAEAGDKKRRRRGRKSTEKEGDTRDASDYKGHSSVLVQLDEDTPTWFDYSASIKECNAVIPGAGGSGVKSKHYQHRPSMELVAKYRRLGDSIYQNELRNYRQGEDKGSDEKWVESTMRKGTLKDRIAAMSVTVSSDVIHKLYALDGLLQMVGCSASGSKTNSRVAQMAAEALDDLFLTSMLPDRKLHGLADRPLQLYEESSKTLSPRVLLMWRFEEMVQEKFALYRSQYMVETLRDGVDIHKVAIIRSASKFLRDVPEGESSFLEMIVNKLGDPVKKTASAAGHELGMVLQEHPNMQLIIAREVQQLAHRPNLAPRALYNCITFLNQLKLSKDEGDAPGQPNSNSNSGLSHISLPTSLIKTYFRLFEVAVNKANSNESGKAEDGMKSRLLSALLSGVNRAHPYLHEKSREMENHVDALYRIVHTAAPSTCTQGLLLLFQVCVGQTNTIRGKKSDEIRSKRDRFYRTVYSTLAQQNLLTNGKHLTMYFNLLYKTMKYDNDVARACVFAKRIMATALHTSPPVLAGSVFLLNEVAKTHAEVKGCFEDFPSPEDSMLVLDPSKRDPRFALTSLENKDSKDVKKPNEQTSPSWELALLMHHYHPSVSKFAETFGDLSYGGDPIKDFGIVPFLDKFAYRNPKTGLSAQEQSKRRRSIAQKRFGADLDGEHGGAGAIPVNDPAFLQQGAVSEQDEFFHKFFTERARRDEIKGIVRRKDDQTDDDIDDAKTAVIEAAEEAGGFDAKAKFEEYELAWESDDEEEAFVDQLALQLIEDTAAGKADYDDEDPDMDDWGDLRNSNTEDDVDIDDVLIADDIDEDDDGDGDGDGDGDDDEEAPVHNQDADDFMDDGDDSDDDDDDNDLPFLNNSDEDDDDDDDGYLNKGGPVFADADEYEDMVSKGWNTLKRSRPTDGDDDAGDEDEDEPAETKPKKSKSKDKKRKKSKK